MSELTGLEKMKDGFKELKSGQILNRDTKGDGQPLRDCSIVGKAQTIHFRALKFCLEPPRPASISAGHIMRTDFL